VHRDRAAHSLGAGRRPERAERRRPPAAEQEVGRDRNAAFAAHRQRQQRRLVVFPGDQPGPVHRHRNQKPRIGEEVGSGAGHPPAEHRRGVGAVGALEGEDQPAAGLVVDYRGTAALEQPPAAEAAAAQRPGLGRRRKRQAAALAQRRGDEADLSPAGWAQRHVGAKQLAAAEALRWQQRIQQEPAEPPPSRRGPGRRRQRRSPPILFAPTHGLCHISGTRSGANRFLPIWG